MIPPFKLSDNPLVDLFAVRYNVYIDGGLSVTTNSFKIQIINKSTTETIPVFEHRFKLRDFTGVRYFYFDIPKTGTYEISFHNYESIVVKKSMLLIKQLFQSKVNLADLRIIIERK